MTHAADPSCVPHRWRFFRSGGFDQVQIDRVEDLRRLDELDPKLWAVLACPTRGLTLDARTLAAIDTDGDGSIRGPELRAAVRWTLERLRDPALLFEPGDALPLAALRDDGPEGVGLTAAAREVLARVGRPDAMALEPADFDDPARLFPADRFNGDGVVTPALAAHDPALAALIERVLAAAPGGTDRSGVAGVSAADWQAFREQLAQVRAWQANAPTDEATQPWGERLPQALAAFEAVQAKVEDHFTRCQLAAYDPRAATALSPSEARFGELAPRLLDGALDDVAALPLAQVRPADTLPLNEGLNPAWAARMEALVAEGLRPLWGDAPVLTRSQWDGLKNRLATHRAWRAARPASVLVEETPDRLQAWAEGPLPAALDALIARDAQADAGTTAVDTLARLVRLRRDLVTLVRNVVNLSDFFDPERRAIFQIGTLYLDQRSFDLCLQVDDMGRHAALAPLSGIYLVYGQCRRQGEAPMTLVAAVTDGEADDMLAPGRNGVFIDHLGRDWGVTLLKVVEAPIGVRQAFWTPYRRAARLVGEQLQKFAAGRDKEVEAGAAQRVAKVESQAMAPAPAGEATKPAPFDIARFAGIFAAIGLALGALGTAAVTLIGSFVALAWWQMPLVLAGLMLLISGPSVLLAWLKLRKRNLGPLLDANGWAVNTRARLNLPFGASLTSVARLPKGAERSLRDPYAERASVWPWGLLALAAGALAWWLRGGGLGG